MDTLALWPGHGDGPTWSNGRASPLDSLGLPAPLEQRASEFQRTHGEDFVDDPTDAASQACWGEDRAVLEGLRNSLAGQYEVIVTERWYGAETRALGTDPSVRAGGPTTRPVIAPRVRA